MSSSPVTALPGSGQGAEPHPHHLRIHAINIYVRNQDLSLRFFVDQLGFDIAFDAHLQSGERWVAVSPPDGSALLALIAPKPASREEKLIGRPTGVVFATDDVPAKYAEWMKRGVRFSYTPRLRRVRYETSATAHRVISGEPGPAWGGVFTHFRDPDGNSYALVGFDEVTREIECQRQALAERKEAERRAAQELEIAREVQKRLFPQIVPRIATLDYAGACIPARAVGGDYFDFLDLGDDCFGFVTGDVAGKGIAAALLMSNLQANLRIHCQMSRADLRNLLQSINETFRRNSSDNDYTTLFLAEYDDRQRRLRYANCGHLPALLLRSDGTLERLAATGTVLGLFRDWDCEVEERQLYPGDLLAVYTDGITETFNHAGEEFGEDRLVALLCRQAHLRPDLQISAVVEEVRSFGVNTQHDDMTIMVAHCL
jgi:serine phosphatase RsbU (regulator of sigma subunit)/catechol 2,3-dioxygenase-like lactoylglutathione lyase family enzyme